LDVLFTGNGVARAAVRRASVAEKPAKKVGQEVRQDLLLLEPVGLLRSEQFGPVRQLRAECGDVFRERECRQMGTQDIGTEQGFGFNRHGYGASLESPILPSIGTKSKLRGASGRAGPRIRIDYLT
jgi:hypothetical protein